MTELEKETILKLRRNGIGYTKISRTLCLSVNTIKSFCRRNGIKNNSAIDLHEFCEYCGKPIDQAPGRKQKRFCSDPCRMKWWNRHTEEMKENTVCQRCGKPFHGRKGRKYCSHVCYIAERFGESHVV